jgi:hypothetical protein
MSKLASNVHLIRWVAVSLSLTACTLPPEPAPRRGMILSATGILRYSNSIESNDIQEVPATLAVLERRASTPGMNSTLMGYDLEIVTTPTLRAGQGQLPTAPQGDGLQAGMDGGTSPGPSSTDTNATSNTRITLTGTLGVGASPVSSFTQFLSIAPTVNSPASSSIQLRREGEDGSKIIASQEQPAIERVFDLGSRRDFLPDAQAAIVRIQGTREFSYNLGYWTHGIRGEVAIRFVDSMRRQHGVFLARLVPEDSIGQSALDFTARLTGRGSAIFGECAQANTRLMLRLPLLSGLLECRSASGMAETAFQFPVPRASLRRGSLRINGRPSATQGELQEILTLQTPVTLDDSLTADIRSGQTILNAQVAGRIRIQTNYRLRVVLHQDEVQISGESQLRGRITSRLNQVVDYQPQPQTVEARVQW